MPKPHFSDCSAILKAVEKCCRTKVVELHSCKPSVLNGKPSCCLSDIAVQCLPLEEPEEQSPRFPCNPSLTPACGEEPIKQNKTKQGFDFYFSVCKARISQQQAATPHLHCSSPLSACSLFPGTAADMQSSGGAALVCWAMLAAHPGAAGPVRLS